MRSATVSAIFMALASAFLLYGLNFDTRQLAASVETAERAAEAARADIAVLRAERAHLARPDRIEPLARAQGLRPPHETQFQREGSDIITGSTGQ